MKRFKGVCQSCRGFLVDDFNIPAIASADQATNQEDLKTLKALLSSLFLTDSTVYLIGVSFCHYHRVIVPAQQMLQ